MDMRIGIDARFLTHPQSGGFKTYTENLVNALSLIDSANTYVLYLDRPPGEAALPKSNFTYRVVEGTLPVLGMPIREQIGLPKHAVQDHIDVMHFPCLTATLTSQCPFVLTLHDTIWLTSRPGSLSSREGRSPKRWAMWLYNRWIPQLAARRARHIVAAIRRRYGLGKEFILGIGSADPRKNIAGLVSAYARLPKEHRIRYQLGIVWTHSFLQQELLNLIDQLGVHGRVRFLEGVSDKDLAQLYNAATLFVFPSHYEGFGLPPLEAMACGTPVVAANNSSIPEVVGDAGLLVDSTDFNALVTAIERALGDAALRTELSQKGLDRARQFSWERFGKETLKVYERALS